jgi:hypothetical protein
MTENNKPRPFSPPPERQGAGYFKIALFLVLLSYALFHLSQWVLDKRAPAPRHWALKPERVSETIGAASQAPASSALSAQQNAEPRDSTRTITKCVVKGKITYNDYGCAAGAVETPVVTKRRQNLTAPVRPVPESPAIKAKEPRPSASAALQAASVPASREAECKSIEAQVASLDSMARQPQSGQSQDGIRTERKRLRDLQVQIPCR